MLTIIRPSNDRQTDYSRDSLTREARYFAKHAPDSDGKLRGWSVVVIEGVQTGIALRVDYLTANGEPRTGHVAL